MVNYDFIHLLIFSIYLLFESARSEAIAMSLQAMTVLFKFHKRTSSDLALGPH